MTKEKDSCVKPTAGPLVPKPQASNFTEIQKEVSMTQARIGQEAPDFEATAYFNGEGFKNLKLSDYRGHWVVLCFYPGDFTFV